ncbi:MAG: hypothetical protein LQ337_003836 [Flavoplaca oasis]|nr:MAG: hypothetical protein LQ337_003836 [Flavoplaca oasis]
MQLKPILTSLVVVASVVCTALENSPNQHLSHSDHHPSLHRRDIPGPPPPSEHGTLSFTTTANVTRVLINNPPINLLATGLISDLYNFLLWTQPAHNKTTPKVVIFSSAIPAFFISHTDLRNLNGSAAGVTAIKQLIACGRLLQSVTSTAFIAQINGRTFGGGLELASQMDMRFAGPDALVAQYENSNGFVAQGGGQLSLGPIMGKARALEHILASRTIDAVTGTRLGLFNNHYDTAETLEREVDDLAARIGLYPQTSLNDTKFSLAFLSPTPEMLDAQLERFSPIAAGEVSQGLLGRTLEASDESDNAFEREIPNSIVEALYGEVLDTLREDGRARVLDAVEQEVDLSCERSR